MLKELRIQKQADASLYYVHYINKVVSDDYELTEQDKKTRPVEKLYSVTVTALLRLNSVRFTIFL